MAQQVTVVTDSIACITREAAQQYNMLVMPINLYFGGKVYKDWVDMTPTEAYKMFQQDPEHFSTSAPSPEECLQAFRIAAGRTKNILCVTVSAKISMVHDSARVAKEQAEYELPGVTIEVVDSYSATASEGMVALAAARSASAGKELADVAKAAELVRDKVTTLVLLDTVRYVYRSGRVPRIAAQAGSVLNIRPILTVYKVVSLAGVVRSRERGIERMLHTMRHKVKSSPVHVAVMHAFALDEAMKLKERIAAEFNCSDLWLTEFSPVMGYATGTGTLGVAFYCGE